MCASQNKQEPQKPERTAAAPCAEGTHLDPPQRAKDRPFPLFPYLSGSSRNRLAIRAPALTRIDGAPPVI